MATLCRDQIVLSMLKSEGSGFNAAATTLTVTKTATMSQGTLLKADGTEATATELVKATYDIGFVLVDDKIDETEVGEQLVATTIDRLDFCIFRGALLKLGATALSAAQLTLLVAGSKTKIQ